MPDSNLREGVALRNHASVNSDNKKGKLGALVLTIAVELPLAVTFLLFSSEAAWVFPLSLPFALVVPLVYAGVSRAEQEHTGGESGWTWHRYIFALAGSLPLGFLLAWLPEFGTQPGNLFAGILGLITLPFAVPTVFALIWGTFSALALRQVRSRTKWQVVATVALLATFIPALVLDGLANYHIGRQRREEKASEAAAAQRLQQQRQEIAKLLQQSGLNVLSPPLTDVQQNVIGDLLAGRLGTDLRQISDETLAESARRYGDYPIILSELLEHPNCHETCSWAVYRSALQFQQAHPREFNDSLWDGLGRGKNTPPALLEELASSDEPGKRYYARSNKNLPPRARQNYLRVAADSKEKYERIFAAQQPDTPPELLRKLAGDKNCQYALLSNPSTPTDALQLIVRNPMSPEIKNEAVRVLSGRGGSQ